MRENQIAAQHLNVLGQLLATSKNCACVTAHRAVKTNRLLPIDTISSFRCGATEKTKMMHEGLFYDTGLHSLKLVSLRHHQHASRAVSLGSRWLWKQDVLFLSLLLLDLI